MKSDWSSSYSHVCADISSEVKPLGAACILSLALCIRCQLSLITGQRVGGPPPACVIISCFKYHQSLFFFFCLCNRPFIRVTLKPLDPSNSRTSSWHLTSSLTPCCDGGTGFLATRPLSGGDSIWVGTLTSPHTAPHLHHHHHHHYYHHHTRRVK